jgi:glycerophosphoryl diester phosphodiesterase
MKSAYLLLMQFGYSLVSEAAWFYNTERPLVFGHAGSSGEYPPYSNPSLTAAYLSGADFIELTVQVASDGVLMVNDSPCISATTNVATLSPTASK